MRKIMMTVAAVMGVAGAWAVSLADARAKIGDSIKDPAVMADVISQLEAADQVAFLDAVNEAIGNMPDSVSGKTAKYLSTNMAAMKNAKEGNLAALLAETFATVSPEALTVINEEFAANLFNRAGDPAITYTDDQYVDVAKAMMEKIKARNETIDDGAARDAFAILMFVNASNGSPADLANTLAAAIPDESARQLATDEWIPAALGKNQEKSYDPILGACNAGEAPDFALVMRMNTSQLPDTLIMGLSAELGVLPVDFIQSIGSLAQNSMARVDDGGIDSGLDRVPFFYNKAVLYTGVGTKGGGRKIGGGVVYDKDGNPIGPGGTPVSRGDDPRPIGPGGHITEPEGYQGQRIW